MNLKDKITQALEGIKPGDWICGGPEIISRVLHCDPEGHTLTLIGRGEYLRDSPNRDMKLTLEVIATGNVSWSAKGEDADQYGSHIVALAIEALMRDVEARQRDIRRDIYGEDVGRLPTRLDRVALSVNRLLTMANAKTCAARLASALGLLLPWAVSVFCAGNGMTTADRVGGSVASAFVGLIMSLLWLRAWSTNRIKARSLKEAS